MKPKYTTQFEDFWRKYPNVPRNGSKQGTRGNKKEAFRVWAKMDMYDRLSALSGAVKLQPDAYIPQAVRWLRNDGWETLEGEDFREHAAQKFRQRQRQDERDRYTKYLTGLTPEQRVDYLSHSPHHGWLIDEIETKVAGLPTPDKKG